MTTKLSLRLSAERDYWTFLIRHEWPLLLAALGVALGIADFLPTGAALALSAIAFTLGVLSFVRDYRSVKRRWSAYEFTRPGEPFPIDETPPPLTYQHARYHRFSDRGTAISDDGIDAYLRAQVVKAVVGEEAYRLPEMLRGTAPQVLRSTTRGSLVFNGAVLGLVDDPLPIAGATQGRVELHRARFFDGQCSNELLALDIHQRKSGDRLALRGEFLVDSSGRLAPLAETGLANIVGISTVAFTADGRLVTIQQTGRNTASRSLLAPSGSGSLEPIDIAGLAPDWSLQDLVAAGMNRELCEEAGILPAEIMGTTVVGYARWLERGAKPEFFGITQLTIDAVTLASRTIDSAEELYTGGAECIAIDLPALKQELVAGVDICAAEYCPVLIQETGSIPLLLALRAAALAS